MLARLFLLSALARVVVVAAAPAAPMLNDVSNVTRAFSAAQIVPDLLTSFKPTSVLNATFGNQDVPTLVVPGTSLTVAEVTLPPLVSLWSDNPDLSDRSFVLFMIDPDAPTPQDTSLGPIRHYLAAGLRPTGNLAQGAPLVNTTPALTEYFTPAPPNGSDPHRYTLLLYVQPDTFAADVGRLVNASTSIFNFNLTAFVSELNLGSPVAGSFFLAGPASDAAPAASPNSTDTSSTDPSGTVRSSSGARIARRGTAMGAMLGATAAFLGFALW